MNEASHDSGDHGPSNEEIAWEDFSPTVYWDNNYEELRPDDRVILQHLAAFFREHFGRDPRPKAGRRAIDLGTGPNLYPLLSVLPWTTEVVLTDISAKNRAWLRRELDHPRAPWTWMPFWETLRGEQEYGDIYDPVSQILEMRRTSRLHILDLNVLDLPARTWDIGLMFFLAESASSQKKDFYGIMKQFLGCLKPGSAFAAAFIAGSAGYPINGINFPATGVDRQEIEQAIASRTRDVQSYDIPRAWSHPLRDHHSDDYDRMLLFTGFIL